jgi:uncharacterized protein (TIGR02266 family)
MSGDEPMTDHPERRHAPRFAARIKVNFRSVDELVTAYTTDLSRGGLYVAASVQLPPGALVLLAFELPDGGLPVRIPARVAYVLDAEQAARQGRAPGMGMQFHEHDTAELGRRIAAYLASSVPSEETPANEEVSALHVLVVEDSAAQRGRVVAALEAAGHRVTTAEHGLEALGKALKEPPDVVLTDVNMPVMDGWQLLRLLRARDVTRNVPVIFLTTLDSERDRIRGYEAGVDDYIAKPAADDELALRVRRAVVRARMDGDRTEYAGLTGDLRQVSVASLLSFAASERRSGVLTLRGPEGEARVGLQQGAVISVDVPGVAPASLLDRLLVLLDWQDGRFELGQVELVPGNESVSIQHALLEHARRKDEASSRT